MKAETLAQEIHFCTCCGRQLNDANIVWLELDQRTNTYRDRGVPERHSQGWFPFGVDCAKKELAKV